MLRGEHVTKKFGGLVAVNDVSFEIKKGEMVGLIGPNGAGKTTLFNCIAGVYRPDSGKIYFKGMDITGKRPDQVCKLGIARTFQIPRPLRNISVLKNVAVGAIFGSDKKLSIDEAEEEVKDIIEFVGLGNKMHIEAEKLNVSERKRLEVARALATSPELILLDEIVAGLTPAEVEGIVELVRGIRDKWGITVFWVEHVMKAIMGTVDRIIVLAAGRIIAEGKPEEIVNDPKVIDLYLGKKVV